MINFLQWVKSHQRTETNLSKREHMACIIKHANLVERQAKLGQDIRLAHVSPKVSR